MSLQIILKEEFDNPSTYYGYRSLLDQYRNKIYQFSSDNWKKLRFSVNPYDFANVTFKNLDVVNRAMYKYWEIVKTFRLLDSLKHQDIIFHCAEAPGGFIQGTQLFFQQKNAPDRDGFTKLKKVYPHIYTLSLVKKYAYYNKSVLAKNVTVLTGSQKDGDITNLSNILSLKKSMKKASFITADGGFDEGNMYSIKEQLHYKLIFHEILTALHLQKIGGNFVLKVFDTYTTTSIHMLYLLYNSYDTFYVYKPKTSRPTNSEKYVICKGFKGVNQEDLKKLNELSRQLCDNNSFTLYKDINLTFIKEITSMNSHFLSTQCEYLQKAVEGKRNIQQKNLFDEWKITYEFPF